MTTFREYREALQSGEGLALRVPDLPSDARPFQGDRAGFVSRAVAAFIDVLLVFVVVLAGAGVLWVLSFIVNPVPAGSVTVVDGRIPDAATLVIAGYCVNVLYWTVGWATGGRTVGNLIMGLRVVNARSHRVSWPVAFARALLCTVFVPGLLWVIVSGANRSVQDVILRTSVIYDWVVGIPGLGSRAGEPGSSGRSS